jgi:hypothetical protein
MLASSLASGFGMVVVALLIACSVVCAMKGKWGVAIVGLVVMAELGTRRVALGPIVAAALLSLPICATRLAKPGSFWARHWYDDDEITKAEGRFAESRSSWAALHLPRLDGQRHDHDEIARAGQRFSKSPEPPLPNPEDSEPWPDDDPGLKDRITRRALRRR